MRAHSFNLGDRVRLSIDEKTEGIVVAQLPPIDDVPRYQVFHDASNTGMYLENQLQPVVVEQQSTSSPEDECFFAAMYAAKKFGTSACSSMFSFNAGKIKFIPYQFRPLRRIIKAERPRILIADEVGVGKTIETGIILKEYERRENVDSAIIVCPRELACKWQREMSSRFDENFSILSSSDLSYCISEMELEGEWPIAHSKCIVGLEMLRRLSNVEMLESLSDELHFDMMVLDEAHHAVNPASLSHRAVECISECSDVAVFLSATPIQLKSRDLHSLFSMLLPEEFSDGKLFDAMAAPNKEINNAIRSIRATSDASWRESAKDALLRVPGTSDWAAARYGDSKQLDYWVCRLGDGLPISDEERVSCLKDLEGMHSFSHVLNRTKRRDIGEFTLREPMTVEIVLSKEEQAFYQAAHDFGYGVYSAKHGGRTATMIMSTIERLITSCLPAFALVLDDYIMRGTLTLSELTDVESEDGFEEMLGMDVSSAADELRLLASNLPAEDTKTLRLLEIVEETLVDDKCGKLLVFSYFKHTLCYLFEKIGNAGARVALITGDTASVERDEIRERFRLSKEDPNAIDILLSSEVGCEGLDYEFCSRMVNYDIPWNPMTIEQRIGRIDRFGQKSPKVRIYNFVTNGTVEERIFFRCYDRLGIFSSTIGDLEAVLGSLESGLSELAFDLALTPEQQEVKAQQCIDNAIRDQVEQRDFETSSRDLFLLDLDDEDNAAKADRNVQISLARTLLRGFVSAVYPGASCEELGETQIKLRFYKTDKMELLKAFQSLRRERKVDASGGQCRRFDAYLHDETSQLLLLEFDGAADAGSGNAQFASLEHPLVVMAIERFLGLQDVISVHLSATTGVLESGTYLFGCFEWAERGYRNASDLEVAIVREDTREVVDVSLAQFETMLLSSTARECCMSADAENALMGEIFRKRNAAKERLEEINEDTVQRKLAILDESFQRKIERVERASSSTDNKAIETMQKRHAANLRAKWSLERENLGSRMRSDILVRPFALGTLEVE